MKRIPSAQSARHTVDLVSLAATFRGTVARIRGAAARIAIVVILLAVAIGAGLAVTATASRAQPQPAAAPGDTGASHPEDLIAARRELMLELQTLMWPIDSAAADDDVDPVQLQDAARTMTAMLRVVPHLFPQTTDRYDADAENPATLALPAIWADFPGFYSLAAGATAAAAKMAETEGAGDLLAAGRALRATCDACHAMYMREYTGIEVSSDDLEFDFDSLFDPPLE